MRMTEASVLDQRTLVRAHDDIVHQQVLHREVLSLSKPQHFQVRQSSNKAPFPMWVSVFAEGMVRLVDFHCAIWTFRKVRHRHLPRAGELLNNGKILFRRW